MRALLIPAALLVALALTAASDAPPAGSSEAPAADTLTYRVRSGEPLLVVLPVRSGETLRPLRLPALSWFVDGTLLWRTLPAEAGTALLLFERRRGEAVVDTLVVKVEVSPFDEPR